MPNKKINALDVRTAVSTDLMLVGDPATGTAYKSTLATLPLVPYTGATGAVNLGAFGITAASLIKSGGTSAQFLKADGSVDSSTYQAALTLTTTGTSGAATLVGATLNIPQYSGGGGGGGGITGTGTATQIAFFSAATTLASSANLFWDNTNARLGVNTATPVSSLNVLGNTIISNTLTGITGTSPSALTSSAFSNNFTFNSGITTSASVNTIGVLTDNILNYSGANTINVTSYNATIVQRNNLTFGTAAASITYTQATGIRALTNTQNQYIQNGANNGTISHYANFQILGDQKTGAGLTTFTNRYGLLINDYNEFSAGNTYTNRWGIYQAGANESNFFNGKVGIGSGYSPGTFQLDVYGTSNLRGVFRTSDIVFSRGNPGATQTLIIGESTGSNTITGNRNHCIGFQSGFSLSTGSDNTFFGKSSGSAVSTGSQNTIIGTSNGGLLSTAIGNVSIGYNIFNGGNNNLCVAIGNESLKQILGDANTSIGSSSFREATSGVYNVGLGYEAGRLINAGTGNIICNNSVFLGALTRPNADNQTNQIVIGYDARGAGSNTATLGNTSITKTILRGTINAVNLPTSPAGLVSGDIWNNSGILTIV